MDTPSQSSPRSKQVTYSRKQKRKRDLSRDSDDRSAQGSESSRSDNETVAKPAIVKKSPIHSKKLSDMKPPESITPVASRSTGPSKRPRVDSDVADDVSVKSKKGHVRGSSSVASLKQFQSPATSTPSSAKKGHVRGSSSVASLKQFQTPATSTPPTSTKKPASVRGHKPRSSISQRQIAPSESDFDDGASVTDSVISSRVRRTEDERIEYFKNQPECGSLEPNRAKCLRCTKYISLGKQTTYNVRPWEKHRSTCDLKPAVKPQASPGADESAPEAPRPSTTEDERKGILLADPNVQEVKTEQVLCKKCNSWIHLADTQAYDLENWELHNKSCGVPVPGSKVSTAKRKLKLVNDPRVKSFNVNTVVCAACDTVVELTKDVDYNLTLWEEHKAGCSENGSKSGGIPFPTKAPPSVGSTSTVVAPEGPAPKGVKRPLEDEEAELPEDDPDARPQNRPRTEDYVAPDKEPPSVLGWFMMPLKSFVRGFKESMSKSESTSNA